MKTILFYCIAGAAIFAASILFNNTTQQDGIWIGPYFSGAANLSWKNTWNIDFSEVSYFDNLSTQEKEDYRFKRSPSENLQYYNYDTVGYVYIDWIARQIFFRMGDVDASRMLQVLLHISLCLIILHYLKSKPEKIIFFLLYAVNPIVIHFVTYVYGFFWTVVPGFFLLLFKMKKEIRWWLVIIAALLLGLSFSVRPTSLFLIVFLAGWLFIYRSRLRGIVLFAVFIGSAFLFNSFSQQKNPWFTMYVGAGAYSHAVVPSMSDNAGYDLFSRTYSTELNFDKGGNYYDPVIQQQFHDLFRTEYFTIVKEHPFLLAGSAALNVAASYSVGYFTDSMPLTWLSIATGIVFIILLLRKRKFFLLFAIGLTTLSFTWFYPPIQGYMFGSYILLVIAVIELAGESEFIKRRVFRLRGNSEEYSQQQIP